MAKNNDNAAQVYAQALYEAASAAGAAAQIDGELEALTAALAKQSGASAEFFASPAVGFDDKAKVFRAAFGGKIHALLLNFVLTVTKHGRSITMLGAVLEHFRVLSNQSAGIAELSVRSARKLDAAELEKLSAVLARKLSLKVKVKETVDPTLMGGFVVLHQNQQWDASVSSRLHKLQDSLKDAKFPSTVLKD